MPNISKYIIYPSLVHSLEECRKLLISVVLLPVDRASNHSPWDCWWQSLVNREAQIPFNCHVLKTRKIHPLTTTQYLIYRSKLLFPECQWTTEDANCSASWFGLVQRTPRASRRVNTKTYLNPLNSQTQKWSSNIYWHLNISTQYETIGQRNPKFFVSRHCIHHPVNV